VPSERRVGASARALLKRCRVAGSLLKRVPRGRFLVEKGQDSAACGAGVDAHLILLAADGGDLALRDGRLELEALTRIALAIVALDTTV